MTSVVIVQARMGSSRLPGKVLMPLGDETVLWHVLTRCAQIPGIDRVCCATPQSADNDAVAREAQRSGAEVFRGDENDVLDRYYRAAQTLNADVVMRVTSDCPLIDPEVCGAVLRLLRDAHADYAANNMPPSWPHGLDCEAFGFERLAEAARRAQQPDEREHVTPWLRRNAELKRVNLPSPDKNLAALRWTLDYEEDYAFMRELYAAHARAGAGEPLFMRRALDLLRRDPRIGGINSMRHDAQRLRAQGA